MADTNTIQALADILNPAAKVDPKKAMANLSGATQFEQSRVGAVEGTFRGAGRRFTEAGQAVKQMGLSIGEKAGVYPEGTTGSYTEQIAKEAYMYNLTPIAGQDALGRIAADILMAAPAILAAPEFAATGVGAAVIGAGEALLVPAYSQKDTQLLNPERLTNVAIYSVASGVGAKVANNIVPVVTNRIQQRMAGEPFSFTKGRALADVEQEAVRDAVNSATKLKTFVTPGEATQDLLVKQREAGLTLFGDKTKRSLYNKILQREDAVQKEINSIVSGLVPEGEAAARATAKHLAEKTYPTSVALRTPTKEFSIIDDLIEESEILETAFKQVRGKAKKDFLRRVGGIMDIQSNTVGEMHLARLAVDDMISAAKKAGTSTSNLVEARKFLLGVTDTFAPEYALARNINQRLIVADTWKNSLQAAKTGTPASSTFYKEYFESPAKFNDFMKTVNTITDDAVRESIEQNAKALAPLLKALNQSPLEKALGIRAQGLEAQARGVGGVLGVAVNNSINIIKGTMDKQIIDFITSPAWYDEFVKKAANKPQPIKNRVMLEQFYKFLGRTSPVVAGSIASNTPSKEMSKQE